MSPIDVTKAPSKNTGGGLWTEMALLENPYKRLQRPTLSCFSIKVLLRSLKLLPKTISILYRSLNNEKTHQKRSTENFPFSFKEKTKQKHKEPFSQSSMYPLTIIQVHFSVSSLCNYLNVWSKWMSLSIYLPFQFLLLNQFDVKRRDETKIIKNKPKSEVDLKAFFILMGIFVLLSLL